MHTRTPGPKQTVPARLVAGCDNQIGNFPLWGVRWTTTRRRRPRPVESLTHLTTPSMPGLPHTCSSPPASLPVPRPSLTQEGGSVASKSSSVMPPPIDPYMVGHMDTIHGGGKLDTIHGGGKLDSASDDGVPDPWRDSGPVLNEKSAHLEPVLPHSTSMPCSFPTPQPAIVRKRRRTRLPRGQDPHEVLPMSTSRSHVVTSGHLPVKFGDPSSLPTPAFFPVPSIALPTLDTLISHDHQDSPSHYVADSAACTDGDAHIHHDGTGHGFFTYAPEYQLSSHSELSAFASDRFH